MSNVRDMDEPLSETSVSLQLALIQKRCQTMEDDELGLSLEEAPAEQPGDNDCNPYNSG